MNTRKIVATSASLLLSCSILTASAHEKEHQPNIPTITNEVPLLEWGSPVFNAAEKLFQTVGGYGCVACHGQYAQGGGNVGGNIRNHSLQQINTALQTHPTMQLLAKALTPDDKVLLARYLQTLGNDQLIEWIIEGDTSYQEVSLEKDSTSQLVILNKTFEPMELSLESLRSGEQITIPVYATESFRWTAQSGITRLQYKQNILDIDVK